ncbi:MAG: CBS domain-containing protein [Candidatus Nanopelagicales bacterium]|nr:CBS domain-containing protein [Candidatus Nanopelagicales bacterium]
MKIASVIANKGDFVATVAPESTVSSLLSSLAEFGIGAVVVTGVDSTIVGIVSERDVARSLNASGAVILDAPVSQIMTDVIAVCTPDTAVEDVMVVMTEKRVRHLPVMDGEDMVGIVSIGDIVKARIEKLEEERKSLMSYITS